MSLDINTMRFEALFASTLQRSDRPSDEQVRQAITQTVRALGSRGCAARMAQEFGDHPEAALYRMRWARAEVARVFDATAADVPPVGIPAAA
jgi:hypothetical protein